MLTRKSLINIFLCFTLLVTSSCTITKYVWGSKHYQEHINQFLVGSDGRYVALVGEEYHYVFSDNSGTLKNILSLNQRGILVMNVQKSYLKLEQDNNITGHIIIEGPFSILPKQDKTSLLNHKNMVNIYIPTIENSVTPEVYQGDLNDFEQYEVFEINKDKEGKSRAESPSSLEKMMISPLAWLLGRQGLEPKGWDVQSLGVALKGTIAHKVFELHFDSESDCTYGQGTSDYEVLYQTALEEDAAFLLQPQWRLERTQLKHEIKEALSPFLDWCETEGWTIHSTEQRLAGELWSLPLKGFVDVVLENEQKTLILDYKKSKSKDRITRLNSGYDLQTLIYRELFNQQEGGNPVSIHSGYYTLNDQTLVLDVFASSSVKGITKAQLAVDLDGQSEKAVIKIKERIKQLREGEVLLNQEDDIDFWKEFGIKAEYSIDGNPLVGHFMKPVEEQEND